MKSAAYFYFQSLVTRISKVAYVAHTLFLWSDAGLYKNGDE